MTVDVTDLVMTKYFIGEKQREVNRLKKEIHELEDKLAKRCTHPTITVDRVYSPGGYDYRSSITILHKCTICEKLIYQEYDKNHHGTYA